MTTEDKDDRYSKVRIVTPEEIELTQAIISMIETHEQTLHPVLVLRALARATAVIIQTAPDDVQPQAEEAFVGYFKVCRMTKHSIRRVYTQRGRA